MLITVGFIMLMNNRTWPFLVQYDYTFWLSPASQLAARIPRDVWEAPAIFSLHSWPPMVWPDYMVAKANLPIHIPSPNKDTDCAVWKLPGIFDDQCDLPFVLTFS